MADERIDDIVNRPKIKQDIDFVTELLEKVMKSLEKINDTKINVGAGKNFYDSAKATEAANSAVVDLTQNTKALAVANQSLSKGIEDATVNWRDQTNNIKQNVKLLVQYESELKRTNEALKHQHAEHKKAGGAVPQSILNLTERQKQLKQSISEVNIDLRSQVKETQAAAGSMDAMSQELGQMRNLYRQLSREERQVFGRDMLTKIKALDTELKQLDASMGNHQRNVGNYKSAWDGLGNSINQITREFPAFTYSAQTGFMAISNNLPIFFDQLSKTNNEIKAMRAEGQKVPGMLSRLGGAIFSWGTALSIGVTLLTVYGKEIGAFFKTLFTGKKSIDALKESQRVLNDSMASGSGYQEAVKSMQQFKINIDLANQGLLNKKDVLKDYNEGVGKVIGKVTTWNDLEKTMVEKGDGYIQMTLLKSAANLALEDAAKAAYEAELKRQKAADEYVTIGSSMASGLGRGMLPGQVGDANNKLQDKLRNERAEKRRKDDIKESEDEKKSYEDIAKKFQKDAAEIAQKYQFNFFDQQTEKSGKTTEQKLFEEGNAIRKANYEIQKAVYEDLIRSNRRIADSEAESYQNRLDSSNKFLAASKALKDLELAYQLGEIDSAEQSEKAKAKKDFKIKEEQEKAITFAINKANAERKLAKQKHESDIQKIDEDSYRKQAADFVSFMDKKREDEERAFDILEQVRAQGLKTNRQRDINELDKLLIDGKISKEKYNKELLLIDLKYNRKSLDQQIAYAKRSIAIEEARARASGSATDKARAAKAKADLDALQAEQESQQDPNLQDAQKERYMRMSNEVQKYSDVAVSALSAVGDIINANTQKEINAIELQIAAIEKKRDAEIAAIEASALSEEEKADKIAILNAKTAAQREALERKQRQAQQRSARFQKALTIASIIQETALAVIKSLASTPPPAGIALAAAVGAIGAARLAAAVATPIPAYADGTQNHKGGLAWVGDGGKKELVQTPSGNAFVTPNKATLMDLPKGTKVFPDANEVLDTLQVAAMRNLPAGTNESNYADNMTKEITAQLKGLRHDVKSKKELSLNITRYGEHLSERRNRNFVTWLNNNLKS